MMLLNGIVGYVLQFPSCLHSIHEDRLLFRWCCIYKVNRKPFANMVEKKNVCFASRLGGNKIKRGLARLALTMDCL